MKMDTNVSVNSLLIHATHAHVVSEKNVNTINGWESYLDLHEIFQKLRTRKDIRTHFQTIAVNIYIHIM